jgi:hypothetical protein
MLLWILSTMALPSDIIPSFPYNSAAGEVSATIIYQGKDDKNGY